MKEFFYSPLGFYVTIGLLNLLLYGLTTFLHKEKQKIEDVVAKKLTPEQAMKVNDLLDLVEKLTEAAVQDANSRIVIGLKQKSLFTPETAASVKQAVIMDVLNNLGPLKEKVQESFGPLETIVGHFIEKHVLNGKEQMTRIIKIEEPKANKETGSA
jgi:hypothetical protein